MNKRVVIGVVAAIVALVAVIVVLRAQDNEQVPRTHDGGSAKPPVTNDALVEEFRAIERTCLATYNDALRSQRENRIDELELSNIIERDVLTPWRQIRARVTAATAPPGHDVLYATLRRYLEARQISWEAYVAALRASDDAAASPHYEMHRAKNAEAHDHAKQFAELYRELAR